MERSGVQMDKNQVEKEKIYEWSTKHACSELTEKYFANRDTSMQSYFIPREQTDYLTPYGFETLPELDSLLQTLWKDEEPMQEIQKVCLIAAMKNKPAKTDRGSSNDRSAKEQLPQYIYNF